MEEKWSLKVSNDCLHILNLIVLDQNNSCHDKYYEKLLNNL